MFWPWLYESGVALFLTTIEMKNTLILKNSAMETLLLKKQQQLKRTLPKFLLQCYFRLTVLQVLNKNVHGKLSNLRMQIKVGRFWNLHSSFSVPEWSTCYFSLLLWVNYLVGVENKHNYDEWGGFVLINCQILKTDGKENPQQLVKKITC